MISEPNIRAFKGHSPYQAKLNGELTFETTTLIEVTTWKICRFSEPISGVQGPLTFNFSLIRKWTLDTNVCKRLFYIITKITFPLLSFIIFFNVSCIFSWHSSVILLIFAFIPSSTSSPIVFPKISVSQIDA